MKIVRSISAILLAILVLMSSTSFMVGLHFCRGEVQSVSLFSKAPQCAKEVQTAPVCHKHKKSDCCKDETVIHSGEDFEGPVAKNIEVTPELFFEIAPSVIISEVIPAAEFTRADISSDDPPLLTPDFVLEYGALLI